LNIKLPSDQKIKKKRLKIAALDQDLENMITDANIVE
jgi:hypothetical protein